MTLAIIGIAYFMIGQFFVGMWEAMARAVDKPFNLGPKIMVALLWPWFGPRAIGNRFG